MSQPSQNPKWRRSSKDQDKGVTWPTKEEKKSVTKGIMLVLDNKTTCFFAPRTS